MTRSTGGVSLLTAGEKDAETGQGGLGSLSIIPGVVTTARTGLTQIPAVNLLQSVGIRCDVIVGLDLTSLQLAAETGGRPTDTVWRLRGQAQVGVEITIILMLSVVLRGPGPAITTQPHLAGSLALLIAHCSTTIPRSGQSSC